MNVFLDADQGVFDVVVFGVVEEGLLGLKEEEEKGGGLLGLV